MITGQVIAALKARFETIPALSGIAVYIGLPTTDDETTDLVMLAHDGSTDDNAPLTEVTYEPADIGGIYRYETGAIPGAVISQSGDEIDMQGRFDRVQVLLAAMENALVTDMRTSTALSGLVLGVWITSAQAEAIQNQAGVALRAPFTVTYRAQV